VTQRPQLLLPLRGVARWKSWFYVAGMTVQLGHAVADLRVEQSKETFDADLLEMRLATPLAVELREVARLRITAQGHAHPPAPREHVRQDPRVVMHVVVGIDVSGGCADQLYEARELALEFDGDRLGVIAIQL